MYVRGHSWRFQVSPLTEIDVHVRGSLICLVAFGEGRYVGKVGVLEGVFKPHQASCVHERIQSLTFAEWDNEVSAKGSNGN